jgi:cysteine synthase
MVASADAVPSEMIAQCERLIRPFIRRTPVLEVDGAEFGLPGHPLTLKLELLQHSGSFKARGAFANLLTRDVPKAGVVAASGGNHGAAVAYAAMKLGKPAKIFVPSISSPAKLQRIRDYGADLSRATAMPMRSRPARVGRSRPAHYKSTPSIRRKPSWDRERSASNSPVRRAMSTRCSYLWAAAG